MTGGYNSRLLCKFDGCQGEYPEQVILNCRRRWYSKLANVALGIQIQFS